VRVHVTWFVWAALSGLVFVHWSAPPQTKRIQLSLVAPHFIHELEWMVAAVARAQRIEPARPTTAKQGHVVILSNITLLRDLVPPAGSPRTPHAGENKCYGTPAPLRRLTCAVALQGMNPPRSACLAGRRRDGSGAPCARGRRAGPEAGTHGGRRADARGAGRHGRRAGRGRAAAGARVGRARGCRRLGRRRSARAVLGCPDRGAAGRGPAGVRGRTGWHRPGAARTGGREPAGSF